MPLTPGTPRGATSPWRLLEGASRPPLPGGENRLAGAWRRSGRAIAGGPFAEPSTAVWLQVGAVFADLRRPDCTRCTTTAPRKRRDLPDLDATQAFSGLLEAQGAAVRFHHDLDTLERSIADEARLAFDGDVLVEEGEGYLERWRRTGPAGGAGPRRDEAAVLEQARPAGSYGEGAVVARVVRVGSLAIALWSSPRPGGMLLEQLRPPGAVGAARWRPCIRVGVQEGARGIPAALALLRPPDARPGEGGPPGP